MVATTTLGGCPLGRAVLSVGVAFGLDVLFGEPPESIHPVAVFGRTIGRLDRSWSAPQVVGIAIAIFAPVGGAVLSSFTVAAVPGLPATILAGMWLWSTISLRRLLDVARDVIIASESDIERARAALPALVGRDPSDLSSGQVRSAAVESLAENLADGVAAPLVAFALGWVAGLAAGLDTTHALAIAAGTAAWCKAVNTLDSMLGYRSKPVGGASARLDDLVMWLPARLTAVALALAARDPAALDRARAFRAAPPSPNSGWPMATLAAALGVRLEKPGVYVLAPDSPLPDVADGRRAIRVVALASALLAAGTLAVVAVPIPAGSLGALSVLAGAAIDPPGVAPC